MLAVTEADAGTSAKSVKSGVRDASLVASSSTSTGFSSIRSRGSTSLREVRGVAVDVSTGKEDVDVGKLHSFFFELYELSIRIEGEGL